MSVVDAPVSPSELQATVLHTLGIPPAQLITDRQGRPHKASEGQPVLGLFGGADHAITREHVDAFRQALEDAGVKNEIVVYDGAPHSFFDRTFAQYRNEGEDAWRRILSFIQDAA